METYPDYERHFEMAMRTFLGEDAYHIAEQAYSLQARKEWYRKSLRKAQKTILGIDTTTKHKERMNHWCESALESLKGRKPSELKLLFCLFRLIGALIGYTGIRGAALHSAFYWQTTEQQVSDEIISGADPMFDNEEIKNTITIRKEVVTFLKAKKLSDYHISQVLNTTEYQIKKLKKGL